MTRWLESRLFWGALLIIGGVLLLLQNIFGLELGGLFWTVAFGLGGLFFLSIFLSNRENWWALIPGMTLIGIGLTIGSGYLPPPLGDVLGGTFVLGAIGLSFLLIFLFNRDFWWAMIPAGVLLTLAIVIGLEGFISDLGFVSLFFLGMSLTFAIVAMLPVKEGNLKWAWVPAGVLFAFGLIFGVFGGALPGYLWPVLLIALGVFFIFRTFSSRRA